MGCQNCNNTLLERDNYCGACGGKVIRNRLTLKHLFADFSEQFFNYDNTFFKTFIALFKKPEDVIGGYIDGTRKKYLAVISYFAIALTLAGIQTFILNKFFPDSMNVDFMSPQGMERIQQDNLSFSQEYQSLLLMLAVPLYALISKLVFLNYKKYNYTEHVVINMYLSAHLAIVSIIPVLFAASLGINFMMSALLLMIFQILYSAYAFKRLFEINLKSMILKLLLFMFFLLVLFIFFGIISAIVMFLNGDIQTAYESGKAASGN